MTNLSRLLPAAGCVALVAITLALANRQTDVAAKAQHRPGKDVTAGRESRLNEGDVRHPGSRILPLSDTARASTRPSTPIPASRQAAFPIPPNKGGHGIPGRPASNMRQGPYLTPQPAAWIDLGEPELPVDGDFTARITTLAEEAVSRLAESGHSPGSPEYQILLAEVTADADFRMRQLYGGNVWMAHHIHSHHLAAGNLLPGP